MRVMAADGVGAESNDALEPKLSVEPDPTARVPKKLGLAAVIAVVPAPVMLSVVVDAPASVFAVPSVVVPLEVEIDDEPTTLMGVVIDRSPALLIVPLIRVM